MNAETLARITKEAEDLYPMTFYDGIITRDDKNYKFKRSAYIAGATAEAERSEKLRECLQEAKLQIEYLDEKFHSTGSSKSVLHKINSALNQ